MHRASYTHNQNVRAARRPLASWDPEPTSAPSTFVCHTCDIELPLSQQDSHLNSAAHKRKIRFAALRSALDEAERDKHGVTVSSPDGLDFGLVEVSTLEANPTITSSIDVTLETLATVSLFGVRFTNGASQGGTSVNDT
jgi:hypothetical protein